MSVVHFEVLIVHIAAVTIVKVLFSPFVFLCVAVFRITVHVPPTSTSHYSYSYSSSSGFTGLLIRVSWPVNQF